MEMIITIIIAFLTLCAVLFQIIRHELKEKNEKNQLYFDWLNDLKNEVKNNLAITKDLLKIDLNTASVYDEVVRNALQKYSHNALSKTNGINKKRLKNSLNEESSRNICKHISQSNKMLSRIFYKISIIPINPNKNAPKLMLQKTLPSLENHLVVINEMLKEI